MIPSLRVIAAHVGLAALMASGAWLALASSSSNWSIDTSGAAEPHWLRGPLAMLGLPSLTDSSFSWLLLLMLAGYALAVTCAEASADRGALVVGFCLVVLFGLAPVMLSSDLFGYVGYARLDVLHGLNPYVHAANAAPGDPIFPFVGWHDSASPYGPLYTLCSLAVGGASLPVAVWTLKTLSTASCLLALLLIARAAPAYGRRPGHAVLLVAGNPLLAAYAVGGGHNDLVVLAAAAGAIMLLAPGRRPGRPAPSPAGAAAAAPRAALNRHAAAGGALALATALKATGGLLLPFALVASNERRRFLVGTAISAAVLAMISVAAFRLQLLQEVGRQATGNDFVADYSGPDALGRLIGTGVTSGVRVVCTALAGLTMVVCLARVHRGGDWLGAAVIAGLAVLLAIPTLEPWYLAWVIPAAAVARGFIPRAGILLFTAAVVMTHLPILGFAPY